MDNFVLHIPTKVVFGKGEFSSLGKHAKELGKVALVVTGRRFAKESGLLDKAIKQLDEVGIKYVVYSEIEPNPESKTVDKGGEIARKENVDFIIAIGGGSVIDAAKIIKVIAKTGKPSWDYFERPPKETIKGNTLPLLTVVTFAATGSELDNAAVITNSETRDKRGLFNPELFPAISIIDPLLTLSIPKHATIDGVIDMFTHIFESYLSSNAYAPVSDRISEGLLKECINQGEVVFNDPQNIDAREALSWIAALALSGIPNAGRRGPHPMHRLEHPISGIYGVSHGRGLSAIMPAYLIYTYDLHKDRLALFGEMIFRTNNPRETILRIVEWLKRIDALNGLKDLGIKKESFEAFVSSALRDDGNPDFIRAKRPLYKDEIMKIYEIAYDYSEIEKKIMELS
ncbi:MULTISPECIES: iron-containing alcohol dehydrogenase [Caldisericum]|jgi:alcohol dehydrogenase YqhD (iron-dependent ADH family)|uniref:iron-containing alcohol dehydrogenase n=2 Tax=Caldisericaceae TaxID=693073 RepID=UPI003C71D4CB